ncbi:MAG: hypothetical protein H0V17_36475, partial [Deltaproteobacteria bacterium]|nr:hypothetical protein [Deltaproteobacteria bacterium]
IRGIALAALVATTATAQADDKGLYERLWPQAPDAQRVTMSQRIQDQLTELGNTLGYHAAVLSHDLVALRVDARKRRAYMHFGGGDQQLLSFRLASDIQFTEGLARVNTKIDLAFRGRTFQLELPEMEMVPASYRGERGVEVRLPIFRRRW